MKADFKLHHEEDRRLSIFFFGTLAGVTRRSDTIAALMQQPTVLTDTIWDPALFSCDDHSVLFPTGQILCVVGPGSLLAAWVMRPRH